MRAAHKPYRAHRFGIIALGFFVLLASCSTRPGGPHPQVQSQPLAGLPVLPSDGSTQSTPARHVSDGDFIAEEKLPAQESGAHNHTDGNNYIIAGDQGDLAWAMYSISIASVPDERPVGLDIEAQPAAVTGGQIVPLSYWVGVGDYTHMAWDWRGPFDSATTVALNGTDGSQTLLDRCVDATGTFQVVIAASTPDAGAGLPAAAVELDTITLHTAGNYLANLPHGVQLTSTAGPEITLHWTHVAAFSPADSQNEADSYEVYRSGPIGPPELLGTVAAPGNQFVDPTDSAAGVSALMPGAPYSYYVLALDEAGATPQSNLATASIPEDTTTQWTNSRFNLARTGAVSSAQSDGALQQDSPTQLSFSPSQNTCEPVISETGNVLVADETSYEEYAVVDGSQLDQRGNFGPLTGYVFPSRLGTQMAFPHPSAGVQAVTLGPGPTKVLSGPGKVWGAPLLIGNYCLFADVTGTISAVSNTNTETLWTFSNPSGAAFRLSPATDFRFLYAVDDNGVVVKVRLRDGKLAGSFNLFQPPVGESVALDAKRARLYFPTSNSALVAVNTDDMTMAQSWSYAAAGGEAAAPCILGYTNPPLVVTTYPISGAGKARVLAINANTLTIAWDVEIQGAGTDSISANANRLFMLGDGSLTVLNLNGYKLQQLTWSGNYAGSAVPIGNQVAVVSSAPPQLLLFRSISVTRPEWQLPNEVGLRGLGDGWDADTRDDIGVSWYTAVHPDGLPVYYALFYAKNRLPMLDPPYTDTTIVSGLTNADMNSTSVVDVELGQRYYAAVRAYVGTWGVDEVTDTNNVVIGITPPWQGTSVVYTASSALPSDKIGPFSAVLSNVGRSYILAREETSDKLWCFYRPSAGDSFGYEEAWLETSPAESVTSGWKGTNLYGARSFEGQLYLMQRNGVDDWTETLLADCSPDPSAQLSLALGAKSALAYTQAAGGSEPNTEVDYYCVRDEGSGWLSPEMVDGNNQQGSDVSAVLDPSDPGKPWIAYQRGTTAASGLPTCITGELWYARGDGSGGYNLELVDPGTNGSASDCGKRVRQVLDNAGHPHLVYLDLNAAPTEPRGRLKHAWHNGSTWQVEEVASFDTSQQSGDWRATYGEVAIATEPDGTLIVGLLERQTFDSSPTVQNTVIPKVYYKDGGGWTLERLDDPRPVLLKDREPCALFVNERGEWELFYVAQPSWSTVETGKQIVWQYRVN